MRHVLLMIVALCILPRVAAQPRPFIVSDVDNDTPYAGEPIILSLKLYYQGDIGEIMITDPSFSGVGRSSIQLEPLAYSEMFEGINYNVLEQRQVLYPLRAGEVTIDAFQIDISETPFDPAWTLFTDSLTINVRPYPEPVPDNFTNGIGQFSVVASASPTTLQTGDAITLEMIVSGTGNLEQLLAPALNLPDSWRIFAGEIAFDQDNLRFGTKTFTWTVIVGDDSLDALPPIEFSYFNPQSEQYELRVTTLIPLTIAPVTPAPDITIERPTPVATQLSPLPLLDIANSGGLPARPPVWFWLLWLIPPILLLLFRLGQAISQRLTREAKPRISKRAQSQAIQKLHRTTKKIDYTQPVAAYNDLLDALFAYLTLKSGESITHDNVHPVTDQLNDKLQAALIGCIEEAASGQYAPITEGDARQLQKRILRVCEAIEKVLL